jgi:hypothetical protein
MKRQPLRQACTGVGAAATSAEQPIVAAAAKSPIALVCEGGPDANLAERRGV